MIETFKSASNVKDLYFCDHMICTSGVAIVMGILTVVLNVSESPVVITDLLADSVTTGLLAIFCVLVSISFE